MDRKEFAEHFAKRLVLIMQEKGHTSGRSKDKIDIAQLAKAAGSSYQMARRYTLGQAVPDFHIIFKIAEWLEISPSYLLFGQKPHLVANPEDNITIQKDLLQYILIKCADLFVYVNNTKELANFLVESIYNISMIDTDIKNIYNIIDMILQSAKIFANSGAQQARQSTQILSA